MRCFVTGGTGVLGRRVVPRLIENGHDVTVLTRTPAKAAEVTRTGAATASASLFDRDELARAFADHDVVLNLATHIPDLTRMARPSAWAENDRIRTAGSLAVTTAAAHAGVTRLIQESITMIYTDGGDQLLDESTPFVEGAPATAAVRAAESTVAQFEGDTVILRFGSFYGAGASHTASQLRVARRGWVPLVGRPTSYQSFVHLDDAATAVIAALTVAPATYNVTESAPATVAEIARAMALATGRSHLRHVPVPRWAVGRANQFLFNSLRVSNAMFRAATPWTPAYPNPASGWAQVVSADASGA